MATNFEVRLLLELWNLGGAEVRKGDLNMVALVDGRRRRMRLVLHD